MERDRNKHTVTLTGTPGSLPQTVDFLSPQIIRAIMVSIKTVMEESAAVIVACFRILGELPILLCCAKNILHEPSSLGNDFADGFGELLVGQIAWILRRLRASHLELLPGGPGKSAAASGFRDGPRVRKKCFFGNNLDPQLSGLHTFLLLGEQLKIL